MATPLQVIFNKFLHLVDDIELSLLKEEDFNEMLVEYLENATVEFYECSKDLTIIKPTYEHYFFENNSYGQVFSIPVVLDESSSLYVRGQEGTLDPTEYTLDFSSSMTGIDITILNGDFEDDLDILIIRDGYIEADLTLDEIYILSLCMIVSWLSPKILREDNLKQTTTDRDFKQLSNANMLNRLIGLSKVTKEDLKKYRQNYSYKNFQGYD
ncbi:MAG: hypothetical protein ACRDA3_13060 [Peptostreptococcaceae bacterium]